MYKMENAQGLRSVLSVMLDLAKCFHPYKFIRFLPKIQGCYGQNDRHIDTLCLHAIGTLLIRADHKPSITEEKISSEIEEGQK